MRVVPSRSFAFTVSLLALSFAVGLARDARATGAQELAKGDGAARRRPICDNMCRRERR